MKEKIVKLVVCFLLVGSYFFLPKYGFTAFNGSVCGHDIATHFIYPFSHANIWHLSANILCLWLLRCQPHIFATYVCSALCSFLPCPLLPLYGEPADATMGFSGVLFAMVGVSWGKIHRFKDMVLRNKWILIIPAFLPHVNFLIHIYCLFAGYLYGTLCAKKSENS